MANRITNQQLWAKNEQLQELYQQQQHIENLIVVVNVIDQNYQAAQEALQQQLLTQGI